MYGSKTTHAIVAGAGTLPFTGLAVGHYVLAGALMLFGGVALRQLFSRKGDAPRP